MLLIMKRLFAEHGAWCVVRGARRQGHSAERQPDRACGRLLNATHRYPLLCQGSGELILGASALVRQS